MGCHFNTAPLEQTMPVIMGLLAVWYVSFLMLGLMLYYLVGIICKA